MRHQVRRLRESQVASTQLELKGKVVTLAGYVVPLNKTGNRVAEFLLVPNFDACSYTTPPPNQAVFVYSHEGLANLGRLTAVRVTGQIQVKETARHIQSADGSTQMRAAYTIAPTVHDRMQLAYSRTLTIE